ncbi:MAG TPA: phage holin family protein [Clostridiales bacterium]|nr:phage holin family protein [Clostridiales bacterium]
MRINSITVSIASLGALVGFFIGGCDGLLIALMCMVVADYITGVMVAVVKKELSSEIGFRGIFRKLTIFLLIGAANLLDVYLLTGSCMLRTATIFFYMSNECISLIENAVGLGLPIPQKIKETLAQIK